MLKRQEQALHYALNAIRKSVLSPYVSNVILFGSCARGEEKYSSDVDLFLVLKPSFKEHDDLRRPMRMLKSEVTTDDVNDPEIDLKIVVGDEWKSNKMPFYRAIAKEGKSVWH